MGKKPPGRILTEKQLRFCEEYLIDYNATQSAIRAGFSKRTAMVQGYQLLHKTLVQQYLQKKKQKISNKLEISQERTMLEIGRIAFSSLKSLFTKEGTLKNITDLTDEEAAILSSIEIDELTEGSGFEKSVVGVSKKIKLWDKTKALEMLAKHFKIYSDSPINNNVLKFGYGEEKPV